MTYLEKELNINNKYLPYKESIEQVLNIIFEQGHSGGSMSIFGPYFIKWSENPTPITNEDSLLKEVWELVKDLPLEDQKNILFVASRISNSIPISHLTGEDDEWMEVYKEDDGEITYQNTRMPNIFKVNDYAYNLDGEIFYEPNNLYTDFIGFTNGDSRKPITFPYDPETPAKLTFYTDYDRKTVINTDPKEWLKTAHSRFVNGVDVQSGDPVEEALFIKDSELDEFNDFFKEVLSLLLQLNDYGLQYIFHDLLSFNERDNCYRATISYGDNDEQTTIKTTKYSFVRNTLRLLNEPEISEFIKKYAGYELLPESKDYRLGLFEFNYLIRSNVILVPIENYRGWKFTDLVTPIIVRNIPEHQDLKGITCYDNLLTSKHFISDKDLWKYSYTKFKENN